MKKDVYALRDPRDNKVCYVGASSNLNTALGPKGEPNLWTRDRRMPALLNWLYELRNLQLNPKLEILAKDIELWSSVERTWITKFLREGMPLLNITMTTFGTMALSKEISKRVTNDWDAKRRQEASERMTRLWAERRKAKFHV